MAARKLRSKPWSDLARRPLIEADACSDGGIKWRRPTSMVASAKFAPANFFRNGPVRGRPEPVFRCAAMGPDCITLLGLSSNDPRVRFTIDDVDDLLASDSLAFEAQSTESERAIGRRQQPEDVELLSVAPQIHLSLAATWRSPSCRRFRPARRPAAGAAPRARGSPVFN